MTAAVLADRLPTRVGVDPRYVDNRSRIEHRDELDGLVADLVARRRFDDLRSAFEQHGVAYGAVNTVADIVVDPHIAARRNLVRVGGAGPDDGVLMQAPVPSFSRTPGRVRCVGPEAGEHTDEVLHELCNLSNDELDELRADGVI